MRRRVVAWLLLSHACGCLAQTTLSVPSKTQEQVSSAQPPVALSIPQAPTSLNLSVALCSTDTPFPRFFVNPGSPVSNPSIDNAGQEIFLDGGVAFWNGGGPATFYALLEPGSNGARSFEVGLTNNVPIFRRNSTAPLFGDSTATQAIIFSPPFQDAPYDPPSFPNYTLPSANFSDAPSPPTPPSQTLLVYETSNISSLVSQLNQSYCGMLGVPGNLATSGRPLTKTTVLRDAAGWRTQWVLEGLTPSTNYTVFVIENEETVSLPLYFTTKSSSFACSLVHSLPYCPAVAYSVPLPPPQSPSTSYISTNLPSNISDQLIAYIGNFTTSLLTFACGRDIYSPVQSCYDCQAAYREWACAVSFPRCAEAPQNTLTPSPALVSHSGTNNTRSSNIGSLGKPFTEVLPCLETCFQVDRACPSFLGWQCPVHNVNANSSYGVGYIDAPKEPLAGNPGFPQDDFGNVWCNYP